MNLTKWEKKELMYLVIDRIQYEERLLGMTPYVVRQQVRGTLKDLKKFESLLAKLKG